MNGLFKKQWFGWDGIGHWAKEGHMNMGTKMSGLTNIDLVREIHKEWKSMQISSPRMKVKNYLVANIKNRLIKEG